MTKKETETTKKKGVLQKLREIKNLPKKAAVLAIASIIVIVACVIYVKLLLKYIAPILFLFQAALLITLYVVLVRRGKIERTKRNEFIIISAMFLVCVSISLLGSAKCYRDMRNAQRIEQMQTLTKKELREAKKAERKATKEAKKKAKERSKKLKKLLKS